jgi:hypothetical protein
MWSRLCIPVTDSYMEAQLWSFATCVAFLLSPKNCISREPQITAITIDSPEPERLGLAPVATTLNALLPDADGLTDGERHLLAECLLDWRDPLAIRSERKARLASMRGAEAFRTLHRPVIPPISVDAEYPARTEAAHVTLALSRDRFISIHGLSQNKNAAPVVRSGR